MRKNLKPETKKQIMKFLVCGGMAAGTDYISYNFYLGFMTASPAKGLAFVTGAIVAYFANKYFTFEQKEKSYREMVRFSALYFITFFVNVGSNKLALLGLDEKNLAFIIATILTMICNFIGQKFFVFKK